MFFTASLEKKFRSLELMALGLDVRIREEEKRPGAVQ